MGEDLAAGALEQGLFGVDRTCSAGQFQRRLGKGGDLLAQLQDVLVPVAWGIEPGEVVEFSLMNSPLCQDMPA
jgi:hypothetical protein